MTQLVNRKGVRLSQEQIAKLSTDELHHTLWANGHFARLILDPLQLKVYDKIQAWRKHNPALRNPKTGSYPKVFGLPMSKRLGKTTLILAIKAEDAFRRPHARMRYGTAYQKNIKEIVDQVAEYVFRDCPRDLRPEYKGSHHATGEGFYFKNDAHLYLVGLDQNPNAQRGRRSDGDAISEAGFVTKLKYIVQSVFLDSYQGVPHADLLLESSAPEELATDWEVEFMPDFIERDAYYAATIEDNPRLTREEKDLEIAQKGGMESAACLRELFNVIAPDPQSLVVPEFQAHKHVQTVETPRYAHAYTAADPGQRDLFALLFGYYHYERAQLVIQRDWAERGPTTARVVDAIRTIEAQLWGMPPAPNGLIDPNLQLAYWDRSRQRMAQNPLRRDTDTDLRLANDLANDAGIVFLQADKADSLEARLNSLRDGLLNDQVVVDPCCVQLISQLQACRWNKQRTDFQRTDLHGHFDLVATLAIMWRAYQRGMNPNPPQSYELAQAGVPAAQVFVVADKYRPNARRNEVLEALTGTRQDPNGVAW